tara:strand:- start:677 stop:1567 length:891 start_codon:yes stop_codon:yes gene_type:complete
MKITITGSSGFIGKHLIQSLKNHEIQLIDRISQQNQDKQDNQNNITLVADLSSVDVNILKKFISGSDMVIHLAGMFTDKPEESFTSNFLPTLKLIEACKLADVKRFIFASSYAVYGNNVDKNNPYKETCLRNPITIYGLTKIMAEDVLQYYSKQNNIKTIVLRFPSIYGPGGKGGIFHHILSAAKNNSTLTINGDGSQLRNYVFIDDIIHYINLILNFDQKENFEIINLSNNQPCSIIQLLKTAESITKKKIQKTFSNCKSFSLLVDGTKAMNIFNYKPGISLEQGMLKTWEWFNN